MLQINMRIGIYLTFKNRNINYKRLFPLIYFMYMLLHNKLIMLQKYSMFSMLLATVRIDLKLLLSFS